jgi:hypothetical protein
MVSSEIQVRSYKPNHTEGTMTCIAKLSWIDERENTAWCQEISSDP